MMTRTSTALALAIVTALVSMAPGTARAQTSAWGTSGYVSVNALWRTDDRTYSTTTAQEINAEPATFTATHRADPHVLFDLSSGGRIVGNLGIGFAGTWGRGGTDATIRGNVPHPFYFNQPRALSGTTTLDREDLAIHMSAMWLVPVSPAFQIAFSGGPTWFRVTHDVADEIAVSDAYPFDSVSLDRVTTASRKGSAHGYHVGGDASYFFHRHLGIQGLVRYSDGTVTLGGGSGSVKAGGLQAGAGLRVRY